MQEEISNFIITFSYSYALWQMTFRQVGTNIIGCFKVVFNDKDSISLTDVFLVEYAEGKKLAPY